MSERVLHEWTASGSIIRIVEDDRGFFGWSAESGIVTDLIPTVFCKELARLDARVSELEAMYETSHASRMHAEDCVTRLEAENAKLRKCVEEADAMREEITCPNTGDKEPAENCCDACWSMIHYDAARAEVDK